MVASDFDVKAWADENNYLFAVRLPDGRLAGIAPLTFGRARINVGDPSYVDQAY